MSDPAGFDKFIEALDTGFTDVLRLFGCVRTLAGHGVAVSATLEDFPLRRNAAMAFMLPDDAPSASTQVDWTDRFGDPGAAPPVDATVTSSDPTLFSAALVSNGTRVQVTPAGQGKLGTAQVQLTAPSRTINLAADIQVIAGSAAGATLGGFTVDPAP